MLNKADFNRISVNLFLLSLLSFGIEAPLSAAPLKNVSTNDSQIVFFNDGSVNRTNSINVYVDKHFNTALRPNEYTIFCVPPGEHSLESYLNDAPKYTGKNNPQMIANTQGGHTYFLSVTAQGTPLAVTNETGIKAIDNAKLSQFINRSPSVIPCVEAGAKDKEFALTFSFNGSRLQDIPEMELKTFRDWINAVHSENNYSHVEVLGYTDDVGQKNYNYLLSQRRAKTIRNILIDNGIRPNTIVTDGKGDSDIKIFCKRESVISTKKCNQTNRRVIVKIVN